MTDLESKELTEFLAVGYVDGRDWPRYNDALVRRGEIFLDIDAMEEWEEELAVAQGFQCVLKDEKDWAYLAKS